MKVIKNIDKKAFPDDDFKRHSSLKKLFCGYGSGEGSGDSSRKNFGLGCGNDNLVEVGTKCTGGHWNES